MRYSIEKILHVTFTKDEIDTIIKGLENILEYDDPFGLYMKFIEIRKEFED